MTEQEINNLLKELQLWMHAAYDRPPQSPETVAILKKLDDAVNE